VSNGNDFTQRVRNGLNELRRRDPEGKRVFGASSHGYGLHPAVPEAEIRAWEHEHAIHLPPDYRAFLGQLGNGGAGPYYGVFKLGEMDDNFGFKVWEPGGLVGTLARPFPHAARWNLSPEELERIQASEDDDEILRTYWVAIDGAIPICHEGCALRDWLVVSGPETGNVWHDATADFNGWSPRAFSDGRHMTFADWYVSWLDGALRSA
jgi:hypothetical protein